MSKKLVTCLLLLCVLTVVFSGCVEGEHLAATEPNSSSVPTESVATMPETVEPVPETEVTEAVQETEMTEPFTEAVPTEAPLPDYVFEFTSESIVLTEKGQTFDLFSGDVPLYDISWFSADEAVALLSQGKVVAIDHGVTVVYAQYRDEIIFCKVTCDVDPEARAPYVDINLLNAPRLGAPYVEDPEDTRFFDNAVFIGDSVSYVLQQWNMMNNQFGGAIFLARSSLGLQNSIDGRLKLSYQGVSYRPEDAVALIAPEKLFVMLGFNDLALYGIDGTLERWEIFLNRILEKSPEVQIYIQSCTPMHKSSEYSKLNNTLIDEYNVALESFCQERGYFFVNIAPYFKDFNNGMASEYSSDNYVHITYDGADVWVRALKAYAAEQMRHETEGETE